MFNLSPTVVFIPQLHKTLCRLLYVWILLMSRNIQTRNPHIWCFKSYQIKTKNTEAKGPKGWNKNILLLYFPYWPESQKSIRSNTFFMLDCNITSELYSFPFNFCGGTGFVYIPTTVYSTIICLYLSWAFLYKVPCSHGPCYRFKPTHFLLITR